MSAEFDFNTHTHFNAPKLFDLPLPHELDIQQELNSPVELIMVADNRVYFLGNYMHVSFEPFERHSPYGRTGECIVSIPTSKCNFFTAEEAQALEMCIEADNKLLQQANG